MALSFICPDCRRPLPSWSESMACTACGRAFAQVGAVRDLLASARRPQIERFLEEYTTVRKAEGRGGQTPKQLRRLPDADDDHPLAWQWRIRARSFRHFEARILPRLGRAPLRIVDLGAGVGWLSYRLALAGHESTAVDLSLDDEDGLGAASAYTGALIKSFACVRADFDRLPFADASFDVVLWNAAFHYSADFDASLAEGLRVLAPKGTLVILDSPVYRREASGLAMVAERKARFTKLYGFPSDALGSREFLTHADLDALAKRFALRFEISEPWLGWRWAVRGPMASLRGKREPSRFLTIVGRRA